MAEPDYAPDACRVTWETAPADSHRDRPLLWVAHSCWLSDEHTEHECACGVTFELIEDMGG